VESLRPVAIAPVPSRITSTSASEFAQASGSHGVVVSRLEHEVRRGETAFGELARVDIDGVSNALVDHAVEGLFIRATA
jgi:hypothetical protein